jgi:hypothetical protein
MIGPAISRASSCVAALRPLSGVRCRARDDHQVLPPTAADYSGLRPAILTSLAMRSKSARKTRPNSSGLALPSGTRP